MVKNSEEILAPALDGFKVIDLSRLLPGPFCTSVLADHGADVIVVEGPRFRESDVLGIVPMTRRNKRHVSIDLTTDSGREIFFKLVQTADVMVEGFRPGVTKKLGVDYPTLKNINPSIIYCSLTGYGQTGPLREKAGHDMNYMATSGLLDLLRDQNGFPVMPNFQMADLSGSLFSAIGILCALLARQRTGQGQYIDASMTDGLVSLLAVPLSFTFSGATFPGRLSNDSPGWFPCYRIYETLDNRHITVGPLEPHLWASLVKKLGRADLVDSQYDPESSEKTGMELKELFRTKTLEEWTAFLNGPNDCVAPVNYISELPDYDHFVQRKAIRKNKGGLFEPGIAPLLAGTPGEVRTEAYEFGEHTAEVLRSLGYDQAHIDSLQAQGAIWSRPRPAE